ncbi:MAG: gamma-glutamylcyclotransferase family protein [Chitinophagaceae bacterium]
MKGNNIHSDYLFVYGTLRRGVEISINKEIGGDVEWVSKSEIKGALYDIGEYPGATKSPGNKSTIRGDIFRLNNAKKVLKTLDAYEGFYPDKLSTSEYLRKKESIEMDNGEILDVWVYWYNLPVEGKQRIRHKDYLQYLKKKKIA